MQAHYSYKVGGSLAWNDLTYVEREADKELHENICQGQFTYVLGPRQIGKSSLRIRTCHRLEASGYRCAAIQACQIDARTHRNYQNSDPRDSQKSLQATWDKSLIASIWFALYPTQYRNISSWLKATGRLNPPQRLEHFTRDLLFPELLEAPLVIFIDEIDYLLDIPGALQTVVVWIEKCYALQTIYGIGYHLLTFVVMGSNTVEAITEAAITPVARKRTARSFNLPRNAIRKLFSTENRIRLNQFKLIETEPLHWGLANKLNPSAALKAILDWTGGQPFLTQKLCQIVAKQLSRTSSETLSAFTIPTILNHWVEGIVRAHIIQNWPYQDNPIHLRYILAQLKNTSHFTTLRYEKILLSQAVPCNVSKAENELLSIGLIQHQQGHLYVANRIYHQVFSIDVLAPEKTDCQPLAYIEKAKQFKIG